MTTAVKVFSLLAMAIPGILAATPFSLTTIPVDIQTKFNCSDPVIAVQINNTVQDAHVCFKSIVHTEIGLINNDTMRACKSVDQFNTTSIRKFLTITSLCETKSENSHKLLSDNLHKFVNIVNRTLGGGHYKKFYQSGGVRCVNENRFQIEDCVRNGTFRNVTLESQLYLSGFAVLECKQGCNDIIGIKKCIAKEFRKLPEICTENSVTYTNYLFDKVYEEFCINCIDSKGSSSSIMVGAPINIAIVVCIAILQFHYKINYMG